MFLSMKKRPPPKHSLAKNLRFLMENYPGGKLSQTALSKKTGNRVSQKTISDILREESTANMDTVDALAEVFGLNVWHMIIPDLPDELLRNGSLEHLVECYAKASPESREWIDSVAEREASYSPDTPTTGGRRG